MRTDDEGGARRWARRGAVGLALLLLAAGLLPIWNADLWWVRVFAFSRLQGFVLVLAAIPAVWLLMRPGGARTALVLSLMALAVLDIWRLWPVTAGAALARPGACDGPSIEVMTVNVLKDNREADALLAHLREVAPDVIIAQETDSWWDERLATLRDDYPHVIPEITGGYYGMHVLSRLPAEGRAHYPTSPDTPVVTAVVEAPFGPVTLHAVHPRPPQRGQSTLPRDAELLAVALAVDPDAMEVVAGDFNAVPWEDTYRRIARLGGLVDPRRTFGLEASYVGRGSWWLSWPIDHVLHTGALAAPEARLGPDVGSDHRPWTVTLCPAAEPADPPPPRQGDEAAAREAIARAARLLGEG